MCRPTIRRPPMAPGPTRAIRHTPFRRRPATDSLLVLQPASLLAPASPLPARCGAGAAPIGAPAASASTPTSSTASIVTAISGNTWQHNSLHRQGVAYRDAATAQRFGRGTTGAAARRDYRGFGPGGAGSAAGRAGGQIAAGAGRGGGQLAAGAGRVGQNRPAARPAGETR